LKFSTLFVSSGVSLFLNLSLVLITFNQAMAQQQGQALSCDGYLAGASQSSLFFERAELEPLNIFSNPLELLGSQDPALVFSYSGFKSITFSNEPAVTPRYAPSEVSQGYNLSSGDSSARSARPAFSLPVTERRVFDL
jgi:hypothetical protein